MSVFQRSIFFVLCLLFCILFLLPNNSFAQEKNKEDTHEPVPYTKEEFPKWMRDLRRAEIIFFGSIPFTMLAARVGYGTYRYYTNNRQSGYEPWPLQQEETKVPMNKEEKHEVLAVTVGLSLIMASVDFLLGKIEECSEQAENK